jgi:hypothetical protein
MAQIEKEYDGNFVCIANCVTGEYHNVLGGEVVAVSKNKKDVQEYWGKYPNSLCEWIGELPEEFRNMLLWNK